MYETAAALRVLAGLAKFAKSAFTFNERRVVSDALEKLSQVYFFDNRTLALLKRVADGEAISSEAVERATRGFELSENPVREALYLLSEFEDERGPKISIETRDGLRKLSSRKMDIRIAVWDLLHKLAEKSDDEAFRQSHRIKAEVLLSMIEKLNAQIALIDKALRSQR